MTDDRSAERNVLLLALVANAIFWLLVGALIVWQTSRAVPCHDQQHQETICAGQRR